MRYQKLHKDLARQIVALAFATTLFTTLLPRTSYSIRLAKPLELTTASSTVSPRSNGKIAFTSDRDGNFEIYMMNSDGSNQTRLTNNPAQDVNPAWSPDGTRIAFVSTRDGNAEIYVMNADGYNQRRITNDLTNDEQPEWSPDGTKIVFAHGSFIQVMNADGSNIKTIAGGREPSWSPDGSRIAFTAGWDIHVINVEGSNPINITNSLELDDQTSWSPDSRKIVFSSTYNPWDYGSQVYVMNADGSNARTSLSSDIDHGTDWDPSWSPDGSRIAYTHNDNRNSEIYAMNPDGSNKTKLTNNPSTNNTQPDWQSLPRTGIEESSFFVRQHYLDFLNREPDADGLNFWFNEIASCGLDWQCREVKRINVSAAFFLSIEFQETGYLIYRIYKSAFGNVLGIPVPVKFNEFVRDTTQIGTGVRVGIGEWAVQLEANKQAFMLAFVQRPDFLAAYPNGLTASEFVAKLDTNAGAVLSTTERNELVSMLGEIPADVSRRAAVLRAVAENSQLRAAEFNRAFVLMQYFGYLRRNPNDAPDIDLGFDGYNFWLNKLNSFGGDFVKSEMVKAFITSIEYRGRFDSGAGWWDY